jgi:hypothetical protein
MSADGGSNLAATTRLAPVVAKLSDESRCTDGTADAGVVAGEACDGSRVRPMALAPAVSTVQFIRCQEWWE